MKLIFLSCCLRILFLCSLSEIPNIQKGDQLYDQYDVEGAYREYQADANESGLTFELLIRLVKVSNELGRLNAANDKAAERYFTESLYYAEKMLQTNPAAAESYFCIAISYGGILKYRGLSDKLRMAKEVELNAKKALEINPNYSLAYVVLGNYYRGVSELSWFEKLIVNNLFGAAFEGTLEDSEKVLMKAIELDRQNPYAYYELSYTYRKMQKLDKARECLNMMLQIPPKTKREWLQSIEAKEILLEIEKTNSN